MREHFGVTVDFVGLYEEDVLLVRRGNPPIGLALVGGYVEGRERTRPAAAREAFEETGVNLDPESLTLVPGEWDHPDRNLDRDRTFTFAYTYRFAYRPVVVAGDDAKDALWVPVASILDGTTQLVFPDHPDIIRAALAVLD